MPVGGRTRFVSPVRARRTWITRPNDTDRVDIAAGFPGDVTLPMSDSRPAIVPARRSDSIAFVPFVHTGDGPFDSIDSIPVAFSGHGSTVGLPDSLGFVSGVGV